MVSRQGGNALHGKLEGTLLQSMFQAQDPRSHTPNCTEKRPCIGTWDGGLVVSGPAYIPRVYNGRNRTFWMFSYRTQKNARGIRPSPGSVPTAAMKSGDFSSVPGLVI